MSGFVSGSRKSLAARVAALVMVGLAAPRFATPGYAQYFGRNKVQYQSFDFRILRTPHFDVYYYPEEQVAAGLAGRMAERWYTRLSTILHHQFSGRQPLILYSTQAQFEQTNVVQGLGEGTGGVTEALRRRIVLPTGGTLGDLNHVIGHELTHAFQYDITGTAGRGAGQSRARPRCRCGSSRAWRSTCRSARSAPLTAMWMRGAIAGHRPRLAPELPPARGSAVLPLPLWPGAAGVRGRDLWRRSASGSCCGPPAALRGVDQAIRGVLSLIA